MNGKTKGQWASGYESFPDKALPLLSISEGAKGWEIEANAETCGVLSGIEERVCVVAITGQYRTGKSSLLNWVRSGEQNNDGFDVGHEVERMTRGLWVWGRPIASVCDDGSRAAIVLMDTEGFGGLGDVDDAYDATVFTLASLLSSTVVYNSLGTVDERAVSALGFCARLSRRVRVSASDDEADTRHELARTMPHFVWVVRDFALELSTESKEEMSPDEYLERSLRMNGKRESDAAREAIVTYFPRRTCRCLPAPFSKGRIRTEFWDEVVKLRQYLLFDAVRSKSVEGAVVRGSTLARLVEAYARAFNQSAVPTLTSAWRGAVESELADARKHALELYKAEIAKSGSLVLRHVNGCRLADDCVRASVLGGVSKALADTVEAVVRDTRADCDAFLVNLREEAREKRDAELRRAVASSLSSLDVDESTTRSAVASLLVPTAEDTNAIDDKREVAKMVATAALDVAFGSANASNAAQMDAKDAALSDLQQKNQHLEAQLAFVQGKHTSLQESLDAQRHKQHVDLKEGLLVKAKVDALEVALRAERERANQAIQDADDAQAELKDVAAALENEERWQNQLQERLDLRIKLAKERESELTGRLERAQQRRAKYTVLDFLMDNPNDAAYKLDIDATKFEKFLGNIELDDVLPALKHLGARRISDLIFLEEGDLDDLGLDKFQKRRLLSAVESAKDEYTTDGVSKPTGCLLS